MNGNRLSKYIITERSFYQRALVIIIPVVLQSIINTGVNMMDTIMVGNLGEISISGSSLANQFYNIYNIMCMGISAAGLVLSAQYWGAQNKEAVRKVFDLCMQIVLLLGTVFGLLSFLVPETIMGVYTDDADVIASGAAYLKITSLIYLPHGISLVLSNIIRAIGDAKLGLVISCLSFVVNIGANYVFIFGKLGCPAMGVRGAAWGTLAARVVELGVCIWYLFFREKELIYRFQGVLTFPGKELLREFNRLGMPAIISDTLLGLASSAISVIIGHMGREVVSAYAIVTVVDRLCLVANMGVSSASGVIIGQSVGSGRSKERIHAESASFLLLGTVIGFLAALLVLTAGTWSISLYNITPETVSVAKIMMEASAIVVVFQAIQTVLSKGILRGGGDTRFLMVADVIFQWVVSVPLGYLVGIILGGTPFWVLLALRVDYVIKTVWLTLRMFGDKWIHQAKQI